MPTKRALIIGINKYRYMEQEYQLKGCVNDAKLMNNVLLHKFNFEPDNIVMLLDEQATLSGITQAMEHFAKTLEKDDVFVFHFSGHGGDCNIHTEFTDEGTGKDNCILPHDDSEPSETEPSGKIYREVRDGQFSDWLARIAEKTHYTTLIFDACYSGTMTRSIELSAQTRCVPSYVRAGTQARVTAGSSTRHASAQRDSRGAGGWLARSDTYTVIAGSRDTQQSKEWHFEIGAQSVRHGLLSFFLARSLVRAAPKSTYRDIFEAVSSGVVSMVTDQNPQIEGAIDREVFGIEDIEPLEFIPVTQVLVSDLTLGGGAAHGVQLNSKWKLYPPGTKVVEDDKCLGTIMITDVNGLSSNAKVIDRAVEIVAGARAIEFEKAKSVEPLSIDVSALPEPHKARLVSQINVSKLLKTAKSSKSAQVRAQACDSQAQLTRILPEAPHYLGEFPVWVLTEQQDQLCMPLRSISEVDSVEIIYSNLEKMAKFRNVLQLDNRHAKLDVECNLFRLHANGSAEIANGGSSEFFENELMSIELKNNESEKSVFFSILWLGADRQIMQFYPRNRCCEELAAEKTIRIGSLQSKLSATIPAKYASDIGSITWKVFFTSVESDFGLLSQAGLRSSGGASNLDAFDIAFTGEASPSHTEHESAPPIAEQDWCAINRSFVLKRAE